MVEWALRTSYLLVSLTEPPAPAPRAVTPEAIPQEEDLNMARTRRGSKRGGSARRGAGRPPKRPRMQVTQPEPVNAMRQEPVVPPPPPADANYHLKFTYGVNAWRHWVLFKNAQIERNAKPGSGRVKLFKTDIMQCTADELNFSLCLFVKEVRKPNGDEYSPDSIYYLTLGKFHLFSNKVSENCVCVCLNRWEVQLYMLTLLEHLQGKAAEQNF